MSVVVGVQSVSSLDLNNADLQSMAISIGVSCCSAGLSFAGRDKTDATVLGLPWQDYLEPYHGVPGFGAISGSRQQDDRIQSHPGEQRSTAHQLFMSGIEHIK